MDEIKSMLWAIVIMLFLIAVNTCENTPIIIDNTKEASSVSGDTK